MVPEEHEDRFAYHFTLIENLDSILENGILATNFKNKKNISHKDIANAGIQCRRSTMMVGKGPGGVVHDYVPFYFAKRTPMLLSLVKTKNIDQNDVIYLAVSVNKILDRNVIFSDASANTAIPPNFYAEAKSLENLDWEVIDSRQWTYNESAGRKNRKMAEMLVHEKVEMSDVSYIVVWNEHYKKYVQDELRESGFENIPVVTDFYNYFIDHYFCQFGEPKRRNLITGPRVLKRLMRKYFFEVLEVGPDNEGFGSISEALKAIEEDFDCIKELAEINGLPTANKIHKEDVGAHSRSVAARVVKDSHFSQFTKEEQECLILAAYLHDIGKGPKSRWKNGIQQVDEDHAKKSLPMLKRIFTEDIGGWTKEQLRIVFMLVTYDDLIGDIVANNRDPRQIIDVVKTRRHVDLLIAIGKADMGAIREDWVSDNLESIEEVRDNAYQALERKHD
ncbi:hypothetical protein PS938_01356 [Pseudomonas fluorescens]|uniref:DarT domain-containing protein n=1 Tax=Pseudomonas fluorescens TaxID=294 RepID=A0A5E7SP38_PSEFL|nr:DarT ssDNA thymidine ADP-ribosyltransferase family protein [Pseudomonas fluorescens]VVP88571.1 hypothetical protein PS938_01356 [Pseudomonas fluorescens]